MNSKAVKKIAFACLILLVAVLVVYYTWPVSKIRDGVVIDRILVLKSQRLLIGYSNRHPEDVKRARVSGKSAGGEIKIHGLRNDQGYIGRFQRWKDWTNGCMALTNAFKKSILRPERKCLCII